MAETRDLMTRLKEDTQRLHDNAANNESYMTRLMSNQLTKDEYILNIKQMYLLNSVLLPSLESLRAQSPRAAAVLKDYHFHGLEKTAEDLAFFGESTNNLEANPGTQGLIDEIKHWENTDHEAVLAIFYVLEGSLNGAKMLKGKYAELFQLPMPKGVAHLDPHGPEMRPRWMQFVTDMNTQGFSEETKNNMVTAATKTYGHVVEMLNSITRSVLA